MAALRLDHVNIRTAKLAECVDFYGQVLGLSMQPPPMSSDMSKGAYACDGAGYPIVGISSARIPSWRAAALSVARRNAA